MLRVATLVGLLAMAGVQPAQSQSTPGHVYLALHWKANPGSEAAYSQAYWQVVRPVWGEAKRQGNIVSFLELSKNTGDTRDASHLILIEFQDWETYGNFNQSLEQASQVVFGRPYAEVSAEKFLPLRTAVRSEVYVAPPGGM
jgi:hypothetical protein